MAMLMLQISVHGTTELQGREGFTEQEGIYKLIMSDLVVLDLLYGQQGETSTFGYNSSHLGKKTQSLKWVR